ncbi:MAG: hypothetical protein MSS69_08505, partial [Spirochaetales bacterium]|nr:hypothetical protein [Spirochaetales bacterium]
MAFGLNLMLLGTALFFIDSDTPYSGLLALGLFFISLVGVFVVVKVFLVLGKNTYEKHNLDTKPVLVFCFIYLLILLLALLLLHLCVGPIPEEERRDLIVIVAEDKKDETSLPIVIEVEEIEENPPIVELEEPLPPVDFEIKLPEEIVVETEVIALPPSPVIEEVEAVLVPPVPSFTTPEAVVVPSAPTFTSPTEVLVPSAPVFVTTEEVLVPSAPMFVSTEEVLVPSAPSFVSVESTLVPSAPEIVSVERTLIPSAPTFVEPVRTLVEEKVVEEYVDPWADFYVSGDLFDLYDGIYWFDLYINRSEVGVITVYIENGEVYLSYPELKDYSVTFLTDEAYKRIFGEDIEWIDTYTLASLGVDAYADTISYTVTVDFDPNDMPMGVISIKGSNSVSQPRPIAGATVLTPATWYLSSSYSLSASLSSLEKEDVLSRLRVSLQSTNNLRILDAYGRFTWSAGYSGGNSYIQWGSYYFWKDFRDESIRLEWGNVSADLQSTSGTPFGIRFDKSSQYGNGERGGSAVEKTIVVEKDSDVRVYNGDKEIYRKTLSKGIYSLKDFVLYTGANHIRIEITPLDGSEGETIEMDINYSSSLLMRGESYYGAAFALGRKTVSWDTERDPFQVDIYLLGDKKLQYDLRDIVASSYLNIGLTDTLTGSFTLSFKTSPNSLYSFNPSLKLNSEFTSANAFGTAKMNLNLSSLSQNGKLTLPTVYARASQQFYTDYSLMKALTLTFGYTSPSSWTSDNRHSLFASASMSGTVFSMGYSLSLSGTLVPGYINLSQWYFSSSLSFNLGKIGLSVSSTFSQRGENPVAFQARVSASFKLGAVSNTLTAAQDGTSLSSSFTIGSTSFWAKTKTTDLKDWEKYSFSSDFSHSGDVFSFSGTLSGEGGMKNINASLSASTTLLIAQKGLWTLSSSIPSNFLLVKQKGAIKNNTLAIGEIGYSSQDIPSALMGDVLYKGLSSTTATSLSLYSYNENSLGGSETFDVYAPLSERKGYVLIIEGKEQYTLSGTITDDEGNIWSNGSSPVYKLTRDENGEIVLEDTELYLFTDRNGIFVLSEMDKGIYTFDTKENGVWVMNILTVDDDNRYDRIGMVEGEISEKDDTLP